MMDGVGVGVLVGLAARVFATSGSGEINAPLDVGVGRGEYSVWLVFKPHYLLQKIWHCHRMLMLSLLEEQIFLKKYKKA